MSCLLWGHVSGIPVHYESKSRDMRKVNGWNKGNIDGKRYVDILQVTEHVYDNFVHNTGKK